VRSAARALVVMQRGPSRSAVVRALRDLGVDSTAVADPFEAAARFAEAPADLVVASLARRRKSDVLLLQALRARAAGALILAAVPLERRSLAAAALAAGADAYLLEPVDLEELEAIVRRRLLARSEASAAGDGSSPAGDAPAGRLAAEVAHAVNNPLQVARLLLESGIASAADLGAGLSTEVERIRRAVGIVGEFGALSAPRRAPAAIGALLGERLEALAAEGVVSAAGPAPRAGKPAPVDAAQVRSAFDATLRFLAARAPSRPAPARGLLRRVREGRRAFVEAAMRVQGAVVPGEVWRDAVATVLWTDERTRETAPGLALPSAVAKAHGGGLSLRETPPGTVVSLRFPDA
jgi:CheY-like chemotaxis protein